MKKTVYVMVLFVLLLSLIACGKKNKTDDVTLISILVKKNTMR